MNDYVIPVQAVEASRRAYLHEFAHDENAEYIARLILEAAAPSMCGAAWEEGRLVGRAEEQSGFDTETNPYAG